MDWLNYHHLFYFWTVAREGGIAAASRKLHVGRPAISMQIKSLEAALGTPLFERRGRHLELTETGRMVNGYAEDIFQTGRELMDAVRGRPTGRPLRLRVGIVDVMAKTVASRLLLPALEFGEGVFLECREAPPNQLFAELAIHELDLVLSDTRLPAGLDVRAYSHVMGDSSSTLFAVPELAEGLRADFPASLDGAPFLMPAPTSVVHRSIEQWLDARELRPAFAGEFEDSALMKAFGQAGVGIFPAPTVVREAVESQYGVLAVGELHDVRERFYAISPERKIEHPAVAHLVEQARQDLFGTPS